MIPAPPTSSKRRGPASTAGLLALLFTGVGAACSSGSSNESTSCTSGQQSSCACSGGTTGTQVCASDGTYGACDCSGSSSGGGSGSGGMDATTGSPSGGSSGSSSGGSGSGSSSGGGDDASSDSDVRDVPVDVGPDVVDGGKCSLGLPPDAGLGGALNWASRHGASGSTTGTAVAVDPGTANMVLAGYYSGMTNLGGGLTSGGDAGGGAFLAKYSSSGKYKWAHTFECGAGAEAYGVAIDNAGNVLVGGMFSGPTDFGGGIITPVGDEDIFVAKFSSSGAYRWGKHFGVASNSVTLRRVITNSSGSIYIVGETSGSRLDLGCGALPAGSSFFVAHLSSAGSCVWSKAYGTSTPFANTHDESLALDPSGDVLLSGTFRGSLNFGTGALTAPGSDSDIFVAKLGPTGNAIWAKKFDSGAPPNGVDATGIGADSCGNILLTGGFAGTLDLGSGPLTNVYGAVFLAKLNSAGKAVWATQFKCDMSATCGGQPKLAVDGYGGPSITGAFSGSLDFGGGVLAGPATSSTNSSMFIAKFSPGGTYEWAYAGVPATSTAPHQGGEDIAADGTSVVGMGVFFGGTLDIDGKVLSATSGGDTYLAAFAR